MLTLIRNAQVIAPEPLGQQDILVAGEHIVGLGDCGTFSITGVEVDEIDAAGLWALPGMVDSHVHLLGGGGEGGPATRAPEIQVEGIVSSGVTTVIGCLESLELFEGLASEIRAIDEEEDAFGSGVLGEPVTEVGGRVRLA